MAWMESRNFNKTEKVEMAFNDNAYFPRNFQYNCRMLQVFNASTESYVYDLKFICIITPFSIQNTNKAAHKFTLQLDMVTNAEISELLRLKEEDSCKFEVNLGYIVSAMSEQSSTWATERYSISIKHYHHQ